MALGATIATAVSDPGKLQKLFEDEASIDDEAASYRYWQGGAEPPDDAVDEDDEAVP